MTTKVSEREADQSQTGRVTSSAIAPESSVPSSSRAGVPRATPRSKVGGAVRVTATMLLAVPDGAF